MDFFEAEMMREIGQGVKKRGKDEKARSEMRFWIPHIQSDMIHKSTRVLCHGTVVGEPSSSFNTFCL